MCIRWKNVASSAWRGTKKVDLRSVEKLNVGLEKTIDLQKQILIRAGHFIEEITMTVPARKSGLIQCLIKKCQNIQKIQLVLKDLDFTGVVVPFEKMSELTSINIPDDFPYVQYRKHHNQIYHGMLCCLPKKIYEITISQTPS